jgi:hypothetical protein
MSRCGGFTSGRGIRFGRVAVAFCQFEDAVNGWSVEEFRLAIRPPDLNVFELRGTA